MTIAAMKELLFRQLDRPLMTLPLFVCCGAGCTTVRMFEVHLITI
jgi:hypothetical protein